MQFPKIISVEAIDKFKLKISFNDGLNGIYDVSDLAGKGVFETWDYAGNFGKVFINKESGAISWPGGIDIDMLNAYCTISGITPEQYFQDQMDHATH